jgi:tetratricopeptide (TPR) repeat protein
MTTGNPAPGGCLQPEGLKNSFPIRLGAFLALLAFVFLASAAPAQPPPKEKDKKDPTADEKKAAEAFQAGKLDDALKALQAAAKADPTMSPPRVVLARWSLEARQGPQARTLIEQAAAEDPTHPDVLLTNASFALGEGRVTDTILSCTAALAAADNPRWDAAAKKRFQREARTGLAAAFDRRGDHASVKTHLAALLDLDPRNSQVRQRLARANFLLDRPDDALTELRAAFKDDPTLDPPELTMAQLHTLKKDFAKADEWYAKAVAAHPGAAKVQRGFAGYLLDRGRADAAKGHLAAAQKLEPAARDTKFLAGLYARHTKDYPAAQQAFEEMVREHPSFAPAAANLALVLAEAGDANAKRRATELAEAFVRQNPNLPEARTIYGYTLLKAGRAADAEKAAKSAIGLGPLSPDGAYFLAVILNDRGAAEDAQKVLRLAAESADGFVYRKEAAALLAELDKKFPPEKKK